MKIINVKTSSPYDVIIKNGVLKDIGGLIKNIYSAKKVCIISDYNVSLLYSSVITSYLKESGFETSIFVFQAGETSKNLKTISDIYSFLCEKEFTRSDLLIALGGGVTGDITGFVAATYLRGIGYIQVPTSLLSQIDSSVGGKTGVNTDYGKNLVGAFYQPRLVIIDPLTLNTLNEKYFKDGIAEAIKYGCIKSASLFDRLKKENPTTFIEDLIYECVNIKRITVENDEFDTSERMLLNFGHTIGHSIEKIYDYEKFSHGQAVSIGMAMITKVSELQGLTKLGTFKELVSVLEKYDLPTTGNCNLSDIIKYSQNDKKNKGSNLNLILIKEIGSGFVHSVVKSDLSSFLEIGW